MGRHDRAGREAVKRSIKGARSSPAWLRHQWIDIPIGQVIDDPKEWHALMVRAIAHPQTEIAAVLGVDRYHRLLFGQTIALGDRSSVAMDPWRVFRPLLRAGAYGGIVAHNHPNGRRTPSAADILVTLELVELGDRLRLPIIDHWIVTRRALVSLAQRGWMA